MSLSEPGSRGSPKSSAINSAPTAPSVTTPSSKSSRSSNRTRHGSSSGSTNHTSYDSALSSNDPLPDLHEITHIGSGSQASREVSRESSHDMTRESNRESSRESTRDISRDGHSSSRDSNRESRLIRTPIHHPVSPTRRRQSASSSSSKFRKQQLSAKKSTSSASPSLYINSHQLEYFTNNGFSRSFNSLILEDLKNDLDSGKKINKSPPFNLAEYYDDKIDDKIDEDIIFSDGDDDETSRRYQHGHSPEGTGSSSANCNESTSTLLKADPDVLSGSSSNTNAFLISSNPHSRSDSRLHTSLNALLNDSSNTSNFLPRTHSRTHSSTSPPYSLIRKKPSAHSLRHKRSEDFSEGDDSDRFHSQQSSIKRSSKFLNLSIESRERGHSTQTDPLNKDDNDYISDLQEIDSSIIRSTPVENSSPISSRTTTVANKFKRPHKFVSQSPSPSPNKAEVEEKFSPSKGSKGFKMFKNADKDAIISSRTTPESKSVVSFFDKKSNSEGHIFEKQLDRKLDRKFEDSFEGKLDISANKLRKTNKSPFRPSSSPLFSNFEYYNIDDIEFDSPSKNRKLSASSNTIIIYQDQPVDPIETEGTSSVSQSGHLAVPHASQITQIHPQPNHHHPHQLPYTNNSDYDDKENKSSYRFVKPLQTAFKSAGLLKKNSVAKEPRKLPPETPIKKNPLTMINTNKSSLSNIIGSAHDETMDENSEMSIEVGRNHSYSHLNDSTSSLFLNSTSNSVQKPSRAFSGEMEHSTFTMAEDMEMSSDLEMVPETPTKSVKKSSSTPNNFSPVSFRKEPRLSLNQNNLSISTAPPKSLSYEPSTPTNLLHANILPSRNLHHQLLLNESSKAEPVADLKSEPDLPEVLDDDTLSKIDDHLIHKFGMKNIKFIGGGEFSIAYECLFQNQKFAIKRSKKPIMGKVERKAIMREIEALRVLTSVKDNESVNLQEQEEGKEYLVYFIEAWDFNNYCYIMTEYCDNGTLFDFLEQNTNYKIDEFRIWKILIEVLNGLKFIHSKNYLHLDMKPANIFVTFEGSLKIGDFGLATKLPILEKDFDLEGDRNYIAPELINDKIYTPFADIFSLGLIILEIAANIVLPENGTPWRKLRSGDLSDAGRLSSDNISDYLQHQNFSSVTSYNTEAGVTCAIQDIIGSKGTRNSLHPPAKTSKSIHLVPHWAPDFLLSGDSLTLDKLVNKMLRPNPFDRPNAKMILEMDECVVVENRRKAGATIFEGEFGPSGDEE